MSRPINENDSILAPFGAYGPLKYHLRSRTNRHDGQNQQKSKTMPSMFFFLKDCLAYFRDLCLFHQTFRGIHQLL